MWAALFDGETWRRLLRDPVAWGSLLVGLAPVIGVVGLGWSLGAVVVLYWLENLVVGVIALLRLSSAIVFGKMATPEMAGTPAATMISSWPVRLGALAFMAPFFIVHYGMFCFVHGIFVMHLMVAAGPQGDVATSPEALLQVALNAAPHMGLVVALILVWKLIILGIFFYGRGDVRTANASEEMIAPYGRIMFLHIGIFAGAFALMNFGEPVWGILALAALKALYDMVHDWNATRMKVPKDAPAAPQNPA